MRIGFMFWAVDRSTNSSPPLHLLRSPACKLNTVPAQVWHFTHWINPDTREAGNFAEKPGAQLSASENVCDMISSTTFHTVDVEGDLPRRHFFPLTLRNAVKSLLTTKDLFSNTLKFMLYLMHALSAYTLSSSIIPFRWSELSCEGKQMMNWVAWILIYLLTVNPVRFRDFRHIFIFLVLQVNYKVHKFI